MTLRGRIAFSLFLGTCVLIACSKDPLIPDERPVVEKVPVLPATPYTYGADVFPSYFNAPPLSFINSIQNPITNDGATLGRVLFYDRKLSANNKISCASCHSQANAFSDNVPYSFGFLGGLTGRNSMAIGNTRFSFRYFWDRRALYIETQVLMPIQHPVEMGMNLGDLVEKIQSTSYYPALFQKAFGTETVDVNKISIALGMFVQSLTTYRSKYDEGMQNGFVDFSTLEMDGKNLFMSGTVNCNHCHTTQNFFDNSPLNNGLDSIYTDLGVGAITGDSTDNGKFKVPSLRNCEKTAPYMHDGRFATLEEVVEHYNSGIMPNPNLDDRLTTNGLTGGPPKQYFMTAYQKQSLVAFLKTLTDQQFLTDVRFSDPFK